MSFSKDAASYHTIVIGSGIGGLTTAALLSRHGKKVLILERHSTPGGFSHTFKRKGFEWDVGVHYVGQVGNPKNLMSRLFDYVTDSQLKWSSMDDIYDRMVIGGNTYDFIAGSDRQLEKLIKYFPNDEQGLRRYFKLIKAAGSCSGIFFGERSMPWFLSWTIGFFMRFRFLSISKRTTHEVLSELFQNEQLIAVLCAQCGDYGLPPKKSSFAIHAALVMHYLEGASYPIGGARAISSTIINGIEKRGGELRLNAEVTQILTDGCRAIGVQLSNGEKLFSKNVVSNVGARNSFKKLWPQSIPLPVSISNGLDQIKPSMAHVCLYVGLNASDQQLNLPKRNIWIYDSFRIDNEYEKLNEKHCLPPIMAYISFPSAKDPTWPVVHPNRSTIQVIAPCPFEWVEKWKDLQWSNRGDDYLNFKALWQEALLEKLYKAVPQIKNFVDHCEVSTPLSTRHFSNYQNGEIYGLEHTPERLKAKWLRAHTPLKNFYLTGQDIVMVGVGGALFSGVITSVAILAKNVMKPILKRPVQKNS